MEIGNNEICLDVDVTVYNYSTTTTTPPFNGNIIDL